MPIEGMRVVCTAHLSISDYLASSAGTLGQDSFIMSVPSMVAPFTGRVDIMVEGNPLEVSDTPRVLWDVVRCWVQ